MEKIWRRAFFTWREWWRRWNVCCCWSSTSFPGSRRHCFWNNFFFIIVFSLTIVKNKHLENSKQMYRVYEVHFTLQNIDCYYMDIYITQLQDGLFRIFSPRWHIFSPLPSTLGDNYQGNYQWGALHVLLMPAEVDLNNYCV